MRRVFTPLVVVVGLGLILTWMKQGPVSEQRQLTSCQSNLKQIGLAMMQYARDYDETFPIASKWQKTLLPYHRALDRMSCTESQFGYATNRYYSGLSMVYDETPRLNPLYFDSVNKQKNAFDTGTSWPKSGAHVHWYDLHGSNVCYADGHVKWEQAKPVFKYIGPTFPPLATLKKQVKR